MQALRKGGAEITVSLSLSSIRIQEAWHAVGILRDITEQNRAIEALAQARRLMDALMDSVPDAVYFKDADSRFLRISRAQAERVKLNGPEEAVGKTDFDFFSEVHARPAFEDATGNHAHRPAARGIGGTRDVFRRPDRLGFDHQGPPPRRAGEDHWDIRHLAGHHRAKAGGRSVAGLVPDHRRDYRRDSREGVLEG